MDQAELKKSWEARGYSCDVWTDLPGQVWRDFVNEAEELLMLCEGEIEITFQGSTVRPQVGEEILIPAGAMHTVRNVGITYSRWYYGFRQRR